MDQFVHIEPNRNYVLSLDLRSDQPDARIAVPICERWILTSFQCVWQTVELGKAVGTWRRYEVSISSGELESGGWYARKPVKLTLHNSSNNAAVDVDNVRLEDSERRDLLTNGDFSLGLDRWFFAVDNDRPWHIWSLPLGILFDLGLLGVVGLFLLAALALLRAARGAWSGDFAAGAAMASVAGFLVVGVFANLIDTPRFLLLFLLLAWFAGLPETRFGPKPMSES
jgi:hypothetical protein